MRFAVFRQQSSHRNESSGKSCNSPEWYNFESSVAFSARGSIKDAVQIQRDTMIEGITSVRIVIADAKATFRQALRTLLEPEPDLTIVGEASDAKAVQVLAQQLRPDVILVDVALFNRLKNRVGIEMAFGAVVMVPTHKRDDILKAFLHGAKAVVPKPSPPHIWCQSIRTVGVGQYCLSDKSIAILLEALKKHLPHEAGPDNPNNYGLTPREVEIIDKIVQGHSNKGVGQAFSICEKTVKHHLTNIFTKLGVSSRLELAVFALNHRMPESRSDPVATPEAATLPSNSRRAKTESADGDH